MERCEVAARKRAVNRVANTTVANSVEVANKESRHGKYADPEKRRGYMRGYMKQRRQGAKA